MMIKNFSPQRCRDVEVHDVAAPLARENIQIFFSAPLRLCGFL